MEGCLKALFTGVRSGIKKLSFIERREDLFADSADRSLSKNKGQRKQEEYRKRKFILRLEWQSRDIGIISRKD